MHLVSYFFVVTMLLGNTFFTVVKPKKIWHMITGMTHIFLSAFHPANAHFSQMWHHFKRTIIWFCQDQFNETIYKKQTLSKQSNRKGQIGFETDCAETKSIWAQWWLWMKMTIELFGCDSITNKYFDWTSLIPIDKASLVVF